MFKPLFTSLLFFVAATATAQDRRLPSVELTDVDGNKVNISTLTADGKIVVLNFWATWCVPCKKELTNIMEVYPEWQKNYNVEVIAVSIDDSRNLTKVKPTVEGSNWPYRVLLDPNQELKRVLGFQNVPFSLVADRNGIITYQHSGYVEGDEFELEEHLKTISEDRTKQ